jgi:hypothetical protein
MCRHRRASQSRGEIETWGEIRVRISRAKISNFANFSEIDVETGESIVIVGENSRDEPGVCRRA